jgi:hypothetical protein
MNPPQLNPVQLKAAIAAVNERHATLEIFEKRAAELVKSWVAESILLGRDLVKIKEGIPRGEFLKLFTSGKINLNHRVAAMYMRVALHVDKIPEIRDVGSLRKALQLISWSETGEKPPAGKWPFHLEILAQVNRAVNSLKKHPVETWPEPSRTRLKQNLLPICKAIWPSGNFITN